MELTNRRKLFLTYALIWFITLTIGTYFRLYPLLNYFPSDTTEKATLLVLGQLRAKISQEVEINSPQLSKQEKEMLIKRLLNDLLHKEGENVRRTIDTLSSNMSKDSIKNKKPYLLESDSFYYYALTENIIQTGKLGDQVKGSKYLNPLMLTPHGHWEPF